MVVEMARKLLCGNLGFHFKMGELELLLTRIKKGGKNFLNRFIGFNKFLIDLIILPLGGRGSGGNTIVERLGRN